MSSNKQKLGLIKRWRKFLNSIPHLFAKLTVIFCVIFAAGCSVYALRIMMSTDHDPSNLLGVILAFFGGELLLMCLKTVLSGVGKKKSKSDKTNEVNDTLSDTDEDAGAGYTNF